MSMLKYFYLLVYLLTPITAFADNSDFVVPDGYTLQVLEPLGGKIVRPSDWFYKQQNDPAGYTWIISKEDPSKAYDTGLRIQLLTGISKGTGLSPEEFTKKTKEHQKSSASAFISECPKTEVSIFSRVCLETQENIRGKSYHIQYSYFWSNNSDLAVVMIFGTPSELWNNYEGVREIMAKAEIIDMKRFEKK